jgi:hypothetical protein
MLLVRQYSDIYRHADTGQDPQSMVEVFDFASSKWAVLSALADGPVQIGRAPIGLPTRVGTVMCLDTSSKDIGGTTPVLLVHGRKLVEGISTDPEEFGQYLDPAWVTLSAEIQ